MGGQCHCIESFKPDDIVAIPNYVCSQADFGTYDHLVCELEKLQARCTDDISQSPTCEAIVQKICVYLSLARAKCGARLVWHHANSVDKPFEMASPGFGAPMDNECAIQ